MVQGCIENSFELIFGMFLNILKLGKHLNDSIGIVVMYPLSITFVNVTIRPFHCRSEIFFQFQCCRRWSLNRKNQFPSTGYHQRKWVIWYLRNNLLTLMWVMLVSQKLAPVPDSVPSHSESNRPKSSGSTSRSSVSRSNSSLLLFLEASRSSFFNPLRLRRLIRMNRSR